MSRQLDMDKCFQCGASKKEAKRPFWGFNHCSKTCHKDWTMVTSALWEKDEAKRHEAVQKLKEWEAEELIKVPERHQAEWEETKSTYTAEKSEAFWLKHRSEHEASLIYFTMRQKKPSKAFHGKIKKITKELERATLNLNRMKREKAA
jgi:hypothetical protein